MTPACCLVCKISSNEGDLIKICPETGEPPDEEILAELAKLLNKPVNVRPEHVLCRKCHNLVSEFSQLQNRASRIKDEILEQLSGVQKIEFEEDEESDVKDNKDGAADEEESVKKFLYIPSSDDDSNTLNEKQSIDDLDKSLEQENMDQSQCNSDIDEGERRSFHDVLPMSESDSEQVILIEPNAAKNITTVKTIKLEPSSEDYIIQQVGVKKPNILKKRYPTYDAVDAVKVDSLFNVRLVSRDNDTYTCLLCDSTKSVTGEAKAIISHMRQVHDARLYICDVCGEDFRKRNLLSLHLDEHCSNEEGDFQCEVCNRIFSNLRLFRIHRRMHYPQTKAWECGSCGKKYNSKNLLEEHVNSHLGVRPYICQTCGKDFANKYTFKAHEKTHEVRPRPFHCGMCDKSFLSQQNLTQHERTHSGMKEFPCHLCGKQFGSAHNLEVHSIVHTGYKPFSCGTCGKAFARKAEIRDHERIHTGERPYQCEFCGATFSQRSNLQSHKRATHYDDKRYQCSECGKGFKRRRLLDYHIKAAHTGERPFQCDVCEATFVYPEHFKKHRRIHTGEKPFLCEVCGKAFNSRDNRNAHRFVHSDKKPYECLVCGTGFMRKPLLYQHMQQRGHLNDTIIVNQPRLTTEDDQLITVSSSGEMELINADEPVDSKLYIRDSEIEHIIIDGQQLAFASDEENEAEQSEDANKTNSALDDYEEVITSDAISMGETQLIETLEGQIQLVKVRIPNEKGEEEEAWIKINCT